MSDPVIPGCEPWSHTAAEGAPGALVVHGFTGAPSSMRSLAEAFAAAGFHVELPRLPGHGTSVADMLTTSWVDWAGEAEAAYQRLAARTSKVVVAGLSMGGSLTLRVGADHPEVAGLVCINPATQPQADEVVAALQGMVEAGTDTMPAIGSDIADPDQSEIAYDATPLRPLLSLMLDGLAPLADELPRMQMPLLLMNSPQDHVVDPAQAEYLASSFGGPVERVTLERSYHVATQDFDRELIETRAVEFARRVTS
ncbi:MAG: alpha/beta fold hydrolase [Acidimicrobiales bacterium]|nr:alpha/beta fold hydrolase [Acidimicrobiales bacterium]